MRTVRLLLAALSLTLALLSLAVVSAHGQSDPPIESLIVLPPSPCEGQDVLIGVVVPDCPPCAYLVAVDSLQWRVDVAVHRDCATFAPCPDDTVLLPLGRLAAGLHHVAVDVRVFVFEGGVPVDTLSRRLEKTFAVSSSCAEGLPFVSEVKIGQPPPGCSACPPIVCPHRSIRVAVSGSFPNDCYVVRRVDILPSVLTVIGPPTLRIVVDDQACLERACLEVPTHWTVQADLPPLPGGAYLLPVQVARASCSDSFPPESVSTARFAFQVQDTCPPAATLPWVTDIRIGPPPVCPAVPIPVAVSGLLPDDCVEFRKIELVPSPILSPLPAPPIVRLTFAVNDCMRRLCMVDTTRFTATTALPGLPPGTYHLMVQVQEVSMCDSNRVVSLSQAVTPFEVVQSCGPPPPPERCMHHRWSDDPFAHSCDAFLGAGGSADVDLRIASPVALAGLQGVLRHDPSIEIADLEPTGPASGMHLQWVRIPGGARFVMFAEQGAPIPPFATAGDDTAFDFSRVLRVTVIDGPVIAGIVPPPLPPVAVLWADSLFGADSLGGLVVACPLPCTPPDAERCGRPVARICRATACDVNGDGIGDVRDLVLMVHCVLHTGPCADTTSARYDCDGSGHADLADVICCARTILRGGRPDTLQPRPEPGLVLRFGDPASDAQGLTLPLTLEGADLVGAARLALRFPADRYLVTGVTSGADPADWLTLYEQAGDELVIGLVALSPERKASQMPLTVRLALRAGQSNGGEVELTQADVSAPDGATLLTTLPGVGAVLDPLAPAALSAARPNPFTREATLSLSLARAAHVDLGVYDLAGRRVATLHRGPLDAGIRSFAWNGRGDDGARVRDGVYFIRLRADGAEIGRKVVLTRGR